jgi:hypothetical protein
MKTSFVSAPPYGLSPSLRPWAYRPANMYQEIKHVPAQLGERDDNLTGTRLARWNFERMNNPLGGLTQQRLMKIKTPKPTLGHTPLALRRLTARPDLASPAATKGAPIAKPSKQKKTLDRTPARPDPQSWWSLAAGKIARNLDYN